MIELLIYAATAVVSAIGATAVCTANRTITEKNIASQVIAIDSPLDSEEGKAAVEEIIADEKKKEQIRNIIGGVLVTGAATAGGAAAGSLFLDTPTSSESATTETSNTEGVEIYFF